MKLQEKNFLMLVQLGIGRIDSIVFTDKEDWNAIESLACQSGLFGVLIDGIERLPEAVRPPKDVMLHLIGTTLQIESVQAKQ